MSSLPKYILEEMNKLEKTNYSGAEKKIKLMLNLADDEPLLENGLEADVIISDIIEFIYEISKGEIKMDLKKKVKFYSKFLKKMKCCKK
tara:strand:+ start:79 stop:345 length:267 start_codon:yes stop_codon:yes gene_type:complete